MDTITINFDNIIEELKNNDYKICFTKNKGIFIKDLNKNLYQIELYYIGSYLDKLIKNKTIVKFNKVDATKLYNFEEEIWNYLDVKDFIRKYL